MTQDELIKMICRGTTTKPTELKILFLGQHVALVKFAGTTWSDNGGAHYAKSHVSLYRYADYNPNYFMNTEVREGRYNKEVLADMIDYATKEDLDEPTRLENKKKTTEAKETRECAIIGAMQKRMDNILVLIKKLNCEIVDVEEPHLGEDGVCGEIEFKLPNRVSVSLRFGPGDNMSFGPIYLPQTVSLEILNYLAGI